MKDPVKLFYRVLQRAILFSGTIADNSHSARCHLFEMEAANIAQASEFIHRMEKTFESPNRTRNQLLVDKNS